MRLFALLALAVASVMGSITNCDSNSVFKPSRLGLFPDPPVKGKPVDMIVEFENPGADVMDGKVTTTMSLNYIPLPTDVKPLCENTECPLVTGFNNRSTSSVWPDSVGGKVNSKIVWTGAGGETLLCLQMSTTVAADNSAALIEYHEPIWGSHHDPAPHHDNPPAPPAPAPHHDNPPAPKPKPAPKPNPAPHHSDKPKPAPKPNPVPHHSDKPTPHHSDKPAPHHSDKPAPHHSDKPAPHHSDKPKPVPKPSHHLRPSGTTGSGSTGSGSTGSGSTGSGSTGSMTTGSGSTGSDMTGSGTTGSGSTGSDMTGSGTTGSGTTGSGTTGVPSSGSTINININAVFNAFIKKVMGSTTSSGSTSSGTTSSGSTSSGTTGSGSTDAPTRVRRNLRIY